MTDIIQKFPVKEHLKIKDNIMMAVNDVSRVYQRKWANASFSDFPLQPGAKVAGQPSNVVYHNLYQQIVMDTLVPYIKTYASSFGCEHVRNFKCWYMTYYNEGSDFPWHTHEDSNMSAVYLLELENDSEGTQFRDFQFKTPVKEGDLIVFPSMYPHRSPPCIGKKIAITMVFDISCANPS